VPDSQLCLLPPVLWGFSLVLNDWGQFLVDKFSPIVFDEKAYDHLVMEEPQKVSFFFGASYQASVAKIERFF
jgi:hypothetical protein